MIEENGSRIASSTNIRQWNPFSRHKLLFVYLKNNLFIGIVEEKLGKMSHNQKTNIVFKTIKSNANFFKSDERQYKTNLSLDLFSFDFKCLFKILKS